MMPDLSAYFDTLAPDALNLFLLVLRVIVPLLALFVVLRCYRSVKRGRRPEAPVMTLEESVTHTRIPVLYWENSIGRSKS